jgi:hypothetical protein
MIVIAVVLGIAVLVEEMWPGSIITNAPPQRPVRLCLRAIHRILWRYGWFGRLALVGMWCGLVGAIGLFSSARPGLPMRSGPRASRRRQSNAS